MNAHQLDNLLKKKQWTGEEVGKLIIASLVNDIENKGKAKPLFSQEVFNVMVNSLQTEKDRYTLAIYQILHQEIPDCYNKANSLHQQFYHGYFRLILNLARIAETEEKVRLSVNNPLVVTQAQYDKLMAGAIKEFRREGRNLRSLYFLALEGALEDGAEIPAYLKEAIEATKKRPFTDLKLPEDLINEYKENIHYGYTVLIDGTRSDKVTKEEWLEAIKNAFPKGIMYARFKLESVFLYGGAKTIRERVQRDTGKEIKATDKEIETAFERSVVHQQPDESSKLDKLLSEVFDLKIFEWHSYEGLPKDATAYSFLELLATPKYQNSYDSNNSRVLKIFKENFPELFEAISTYITETIPPLKKLDDFPNEEYFGFGITQGELADFGFIGFSEIKPDNDNLLRAFKTLYPNANTYIVKNRLENGIAILQDTQKDSITYDEPTGWLSEHEREEIEEKNIFLLNKLLYPAIQYISCYNALIEILSKVLDIPEFVNAKVDTSDLEAKAITYNDLVYVTYKDTIGNDNEKAEKRLFIKNNFPLLDYSKLQPPLTGRRKVSRELTAIRKNLNPEEINKLFDLEGYIYQLLNSGKGEKWQR